MFGFHKERRLTLREVDEAVKNAVSDATLASTLANHMAQCEKDKAESKADRDRMHAENTTKFAAQDKKFDLLFKVIWIATGVGAALSIGGKEVLSKIIGG